MNFSQIPPPEYLQRYIRYFWTLESDHVHDEPAIFRTMADGCPGLIFQPSDKGIFYQENKLLPDTFLYGQSTKYAELQLKGQFRSIGIFFYPNVLKAIFGLDAEALTNSCLDLNELAERQGYHLSEQLAAAADAQEQIELLSAYLLFLLRKNAGLEDELIHFALTRIIRSKGCIVLKELQERLQLSERSFERRFKQYTGLSPKLFSRICRFQASLGQLRDNKYDKLSDIAFENEYADQSHFIRAFNEFAGCSPYQYQKNAREVVENLAALSK